jgi:hypothetical protein
VVGLDQSTRIRAPRLFGELETIDDVATKDRQPNAIDLFIGLRARLCVLTRNPPNLDDRQAGCVGQHDSHLQDRFEFCPDVFGICSGEPLGAVATHQQEGITPCDGRKPITQIVTLSGEDQGRHRRELPDRLLTLTGIRPFRLLSGR